MAYDKKSIYILRGSKILSYEKARIKIHATKNLAILKNNFNIGSLVALIEPSR
jgi:hypothetical protein